VGNGNLLDPAENDLIPSPERDAKDVEHARTENDLIPGGLEPFDDRKLLVPGYAERYPLEPQVIEAELETATAPAEGVHVSNTLFLQPLGRIQGLLVMKRDPSGTAQPVTAEKLSVEDRKAIREYLDHGRGGNDLIPE
jgi:hypothetical protein